ncbi:MAG: hypothetical protein KF744_15580 [Taibaiella sp.]|nr:hypothetical protein [Taibaiella sp.]
MKQLLMALVMTAIACTNAEAQTKATPRPQEKCAISKDGKYITCCKTTLNPAYNINNKTAVVTHKKHAPRKKATKTAQVAPKPIKTYHANKYLVCTDQGGYYTCCLHNNSSTTEITPEW